MKYYLHDSNAFNDEKITELFIIYGYEGLGLFYTILEKLAQQEKPIKTVVLKAQLKVGKKLEKCWSFMESIELISSNNGETFNKQLMNFSGKYAIKKEKNKKRISEWRERQVLTENVTCNEIVCNTDKLNKSKIKESNNINHSDLILWRNNFEKYIEELNIAVNTLLQDKEWIAEREKFHPNLDIKLSMEKAYKDFWGTEAGWKHKKKSKSNDINWKSTFNSAIELNKVFKQR